MCYDFTSKEMIGLKKEPVQVKKSTRGSWDSFTTVTLAAVPIFF